MHSIILQRVKTISSISFLAALRNRSPNLSAALATIHTLPHNPAL
jgi:hypothetical protein